MEILESREDIISVEKLDLEKMITEGVEVSTYKLKYQSDNCTVVSYLSVPNECIEERKAYLCIIFNWGGNREFSANAPESNPTAYEKRSAVLWADEIKCPILIIHSKLDQRSSFEQAEKMVEALEEAGKEYKFISYEDDVHGLHPEDFSIIMEWCQ